MKNSYTYTPVGAHLLPTKNAKKMSDQFNNPLVIHAAWNIMALGAACKF